MAVAYHFFKDFDTAGGVYERIRKTYDGPLDLAEDFMVWNVTKDQIRTRLAVAAEDTWSPPLGRPAQAPSLDDRVEFASRAGIPADKIGFSDFTKAGFWNVDDVLRPIYEEAEQAVGREFPYPDEEAKR